ncbi:AfsR/SARP family transcriptional regulator [Actinokineospora sp. NBRC 105648]|uniref:AfsR/SARP family transcriptional regulator n=1 Tax=Actinokineospora sp. NBRC 105648 TaxID=3032206 RepID=UPI00249FF868|nr:AfsR/SARP family transcriptional regulator [Actinokineospora sp. NBRC 105648]GLZ41929.1 SARP family transcriptional regulator [Actinokineospora sp. NBRC 105648]
MDFRVLGPVEAWREDRPLPIGGPKQRSSLAVLLLNANRVVPLDYFVTHLTADDRRDARGAVRRQMSRLRKVLNDNAAAPVLTARQGGYALSVDPEAVDLRRFERLVAQGRAARAAGEPARAVELLGEALALWRGPALTGVLDGVREASAARLEEARMQVVEDLAELRIALGEHERVVAELSEVVVLDPTRERLVGLLMLGLSRSGRQAEALEVFSRTRRLLVEELGLEPGGALRRVQQAILSGPETEPVPRCHPRAPAPAQLPADLATFTGRSAELAVLLSARSAATVTVCAIDGMAGVGKSALAVHAAHRLAPHYPDGQLFVDLCGFTEGRDPVEPFDALDRVLRAIGLTGEQIPATLDERAALWRGRVAGKRVLTVLDNAAHESQVRPLLPAGPGCLVLVTSRRRLAGLDDTRAVSLDVFSRADAITLFTRATDHDPVAAARPDRVAEIVELCARLPLAIRVAAARLRHRSAWTVDHLAERLRDEHRRLTELAAGDRSVTAAFDLSYAHLDRPRQRMFRLLGLHPGPDIDVAAAAALTRVPTDDAGRLLEDLVDAHLVQQRKPGRYRMHDLVRAHAARLVVQTDPPPRRRAALARLLDHYVRTAAAATRVAYPREVRRHGAVPAPARPFAGKASAVTWLEAELPNLLAVAAQAAGITGLTDYTVSLSALLHPYLRTCGQCSDAKALHGQAVRAAGDTGDQVGLTRALTDLGTMHLVRARHEEANDRPQRVRREYSSAAEYLGQALEATRATGDRAAEPALLDHLGHIHRALGDHDRARQAWRRALTALADLDLPADADEIRANLAAL